MSKKLLCLLFGFLICSGIACGKPSNGYTTITSSTKVVDSNVSTPTKQEEIADNASDYTGETLIDNDFCVFKITGIDSDKWGNIVSIYCENKTPENLSFSWDKVSVNGVMCDPFWATEVSAGKKANSNIHFSFDDTTMPDEITFTLRVSSADDWSKDPYVYQEFSIYPTGLSANTFTPVEQDLSSAIPIFENESARFLILGTQKDDLFGYGVNLYCENKSDKTLNFSWDNVSVNDYMIDPFWGTEVAPGKVGLSTAYFGDSIQENGISEVEKIEFTLRISDSDNWMADPIVKSTYIYNIKGE